MIFHKKKSEIISLLNQYFFILRTIGIEQKDFDYA